MARQGTVALAFHIAPFGHQCRVTVNGQLVERIRSFDIHAAHDEATTIYLEATLSDGSEIDYSGRLLPDEPTAGPGGGQ